MIIPNFKERLEKLNKMEEAMKKRWIYNHNIMEEITKAKRRLIKNQEEQLDGNN